jgi:V/A-type H+-transporting ATPase subunit C
VGRVRALEADLLDRQHVDRLVESRDDNELLQVMRETEYGQQIDLKSKGGGGLPFSDFESVLETGKERIYRVFAELCQDDTLRELILSRHDFHNLKTFIKNSDKEGEIDAGISPFGAFSFEKMINIVKEKRIQELPHQLRKAAGEIFEKGDPIPDEALQWIDVSVDHEMFRFWLACVDEMKNEFLTGLIRHILDLENIKAFYRIRWRKGDHDLLNSVLFFDGWREFDSDGSSMEGDRFQKAFESSWEGIPSFFFATPYESIVREGGEYLVREGSFALLEKMCDDFVIQYLRATRLLSFGFEPLVAYHYAKENELKILRLIFFCKNYGLTIDKIRARVPEVF